MDPKLIRETSIQTAKRLGVEVPPTLPLLDGDVHMRCAGDVLSRMLAMHAVAAAAYGYDRKKAIAWLSQEELTGRLTEGERHFLIQGLGYVDDFRLQVEAIWALAWSLGIVSELDFAKRCDHEFVSIMPNLKAGESTIEVRRKVSPRLREKVVQACDLAYCLHWAIRNSELNGNALPSQLIPYVITERRRALEWLLSSEDWDKITLDT